jgi:hypothetical protein
MIIFIDLFKQASVSEIILFSVAIIGFVGTVIVGIIKFAHWLALRNNQWLLNENLRPYFSASDVDRATRYYIPTKFQNVSPAADEEPGKSHMASAKQLLMPMFLDTVFKNKNAETKYYLILADAGMGKTTFLINLFLNYARNPVRNLSGSNDDQPIKLFPLGSPDIWADIKNIKNKRDTILLLDAFDEDIKAVDDYDARMKEILKKTKDFKEIIITCRTQFFPSDKEIPDDTGYTTFGGDQEPVKFQRVYLSVFDEEDINKYLKKRFSFFQFSKRRKAFEIVKKSPNLVMRPMLLSYINDFVEADRTFNYSYEIYEVLIEKWIERESKKHGIRKKYDSEEKYQDLLLNFSRALAVNLYEKRGEREGYFITKADIIADTGGFQITDVDNDSLGETEVRSKSLLNRDAEGKYKFSHKSILEYFLAKELTKRKELLSTFDFEGMSATKMFVDELLDPLRKVPGFFSFDTKSYSKLSDLTVYDINLIEILKISHVDDFDVLSKLSYFPNLECIVLLDSHKFHRLYDLYFIFSIPVHYHGFDDLIQGGVLIPASAWEEKFARLGLRQLAKRANELGEGALMQDWQDILLGGVYRFTHVEAWQPTNVIEFRSTRSIYEQEFAGIDIRHWRKRVSQVVALFNEDDSEFLNAFFSSELYLRRIDSLHTELPKCDLIY